MVPQIAATLGMTISKMPAVIANPILGGSIANMLGHISDDTWTQIKEESKKPCGDPGCDCHISHQPLMVALDALREEWKRLTSEAHDDSEEKGFST